MTERSDRIGAGLLLLLIVAALVGALLWLLPKAGVAQ